MWYTVLAFAVVCFLAFILKQLRDTGPNRMAFYSKFLIFHLSMWLFAAVIWPYFLLNPKDNRNVKFASRILKHVTKIYDVKWQLRNGKYLSEDRGAVVVSNHQSSLDILGMFNIWEVADKITVIAKKELFYMWPFGFSAYLAGVVFIDRRNSKGAYKQLQVTSEVMIKKKALVNSRVTLPAVRKAVFQRRRTAKKLLGCSFELSHFFVILTLYLINYLCEYHTKIWVFPEGTRNKDYTKLLPFKKGAFNIAVAAQVPIIPVVFSPYYFINSEKYVFNKGHVVIQCLEPISTKGLKMEDVPDLIQKVHDLMTETYKKLYKEVLNDLPADYYIPLWDNDNNNKKAYYKRLI